MTVRQLLDFRADDGSRQFGALPETYDVESPQWHELRTHLRGLPGASEREFCTDDIAEAWIDFDFRGHRFTLNNQCNEWWFFVDDPACPDAVLHEVLQWFEQILAPGTRPAP